MQLSLTLTLLAALLDYSLAAQPDCTTDGHYKPGSTAIYMPFRGSSIECELGTGNNSNAVKALQTQINLCYGGFLDAKLVVDGDFGSKTRAAVRIVQGKAGAGVDGRYGKETRTKMNWGVVFNGDETVCKKLSAWS